MSFGDGGRCIPRGPVVTPALTSPMLYEAVVTHARRAPIENSFRYRTSYWLVDFDQLPKPTGWRRWFGAMRYEDHLDVRDVLARRGIAADRILMLAAARTFGYVFDPITVLWCYDQAGEPTAVVAEVHNTYGDRHAYVLEPGSTDATEIGKEMYVSPFYPVDGRYRIRVSEPGSSLSVSVTLDRDGDPPFVATMRGERQSVSVRTVVRSALRYSSARTSVLIRWQALKLWIRGLEVQPR